MRMTVCSISFNTDFVMEQTNREWTLHEVRDLFVRDCPQVTAWASECGSGEAFRQRLKEELQHRENLSAKAARTLRIMADYDGRTVHELSTGEDVRLETMTLLWRFLTQQMVDDAVSIDFALDLYHLFSQLFRPVSTLPGAAQVRQWMDRWPDGMDETVQAVRRANKERMVPLLVRRIEQRPASLRHYVFASGMTAEEKRRQVLEWWNEIHFQLVMAAKTPEELNALLGGVLSAGTLDIYRRAQAKGIPIFVTPYYLSLLDPSGRGYDDAAIRSYVIYSSRLVEAFGHIRAWEREDVVEEGRPNVAGWLLPGGHNIHRRYPEVAILIPDTMGRACGGLCASCQRMYDFQSRRLNFDLERLKPHESWNDRLRHLMDYFEQDTQLRDILITGGDALMSRNATLRGLLEAVYDMAVRKREANRRRPDGEKYAELQRVRLGTRLPVYLPMRVDDELVDILRGFREKAAAVGVRQFFVQTHFQSPLEVTPESCEALRRIQSAGWTVTNQLVFNVAASRRGHTAALRRVLNRLGVVCYYTFSVKGFDENYELFAPNARSLQEACEEKVLGRLTPDGEAAFTACLSHADSPATALRGFCAERGLPFVTTDRNVLNLPGVGKSMTFVLAGIGADGRRILRFDHDRTRRHSPVIDRMGEVYIKENKSLYRYLLQLEAMGEDIGDYAGLWNYTEGQTERRVPFFDYPQPDFRITGRFTNLELGEG